MDFATADHHFGHARIAGYTGRPFDDVNDMDAALVDAWNDTVRPGDTVWVLGDVALGKLADSLALIDLLHGTKLLVPGNHDRCWVGHRKSDRSRQAYLDAGFAAIIDDPDPFILAGVTCRVSHFPYRGTGDHRDNERYQDWRPQDDGGWLIHGHVHERWRQSGRQINVGIDAWAGRPVSFDTLAAVVGDGPGNTGPLPWT